MKDTTTLIKSDEVTKLEGFASEEEMLKWAANRIESGFLPASISEPEQVVTIAMQGKELGLAPMTSLNNIHVIAGRPVLSSSLLGALLKRRGIEWTWDEDFVPHGDGKDQTFRTTIHFFWKSVITERVMETTFSCTWKQMELAGYTKKDNWKKYPKEMLRARTLAYSVRALFPDIMMGMYSDLEMNDATGEDMPVEMTEDGDIQIIPVNE